VNGIPEGACRRVGVTARVAVVLGLLLGVSLMSGCNTVAGVGRDIQSMADGGQRLIDDMSNTGGEEY